MSTSSYISIFHSDFSIKKHKEFVNKAFEAFKELYNDEPYKIEIAEAFAKYLIHENPYFSFINHSSEHYKEEFIVAFEFAKLLAYAFDDWAIIKFGTELEEFEDEWYLISKEHGLIRLKKDETFRKEIEYLFTKAEFLKWKRKLEELEKERDEREP